MYLGLRHTSLVRANVSDRTKCLQRLEIANNDVSLDHSLGSGSHCDRQDDDERGWNHTQASGDSVDDDLLLARKVVGCKDDDRTYNSNPKQEHCETRQFLLERRSYIDSEEAANGVGRSQTPSLRISMRSSFALFVAFDGSDLKQY